METVENLMREIAHMDTEIPVYNVNVRASSHSSEFMAWVDFRSLGQDYSSVTSTAPSPEDALKALRTTLRDKFMSRTFYQSHVSRQS